MATQTDLSDRQAAALWAYELVHSADGFVVLDTETTGLDRDRRDEACQIAIVDHTGAVLLDTLVRPTLPIDPGAAAVHGITDEMVKDAPPFLEVWPLVQAALQDRTLTIYNWQYDVGILHNMLMRAGLFMTPQGDFGYRDGTCAMEQYAAFYGDWNSRYHSYRWQKLTAACVQMRVSPVDAPPHSALGDCLRALRVIEKMAEAWPDD